MAQTTITITAAIWVFIFFLFCTDCDCRSATSSFSKIYAFGDSFTDTGNTHSGKGPVPVAFGYVSRPPYGATFFHHSTNRYSDGRLVVDFLANTLSLPFLLPYLNNEASDFSNGVNFAVAGSTALDHQFFVRHNISIDVTPQSLSTQLLWFDTYLKKMGCRKRNSPACRRLLDDALFWVGEIGVNDYAYITGSSVAPDMVRSLAVNNVTTFLKALLDRGANYMVVQGQPLAGCLPLTMYLTTADDRDEIGCSAISNNYTHTYNTLLQSKLRGLRREYPHSKISYADYYGAHHAIMKNPTAHGFSEPFKVCCGAGGGTYNFDVFQTCGSPSVSKACVDPTKFVNWDGVHLTEAMYKVIAGLFFDHGYCRPSFQDLLKSKGIVA